MSASMTASAWWTSLSNCAMCFVSSRMCRLAVDSTADARPICFLFSDLVNHVHTLVLLDGGVSDRLVIDLILCAGAVVLTAGFVLAL